MKCLKILCALVMIASILFSMSAVTYAAGSVTYDGNANEFIFEPGSDKSPTDLFDGFEDVMPGDSITERIEIRSVPSKKYKLRVYMRSLGAQKGTDDFLEQMTLTVKPVGAPAVFEAPADETAQLTDWVHLGTIRYDGKILLDVTLNVPITMGNEYQKELGYIDWQFKVEEIPIDPNLPSTGDTSNLLLYVGLFAVGASGLIILLIVAKRRKKDEKQ